jgi:hypothetical protein
MPQLAVIQWNTSADMLPVVDSMQLPPEFKVTAVKLDPNAYSPPPRRNSAAVV